MSRKMWTCRNGRKVRICDMTDEHLRNAIRYLDRAHDAALLEGIPSFNGEMAQYYAEQAWSAALNEGPSETYPIYDDLVEELEKRNSSRVSNTTRPTCP